MLSERHRRTIVERRCSGFLFAQVLLRAVPRYCSLGGPGGDPLVDYPLWTLQRRLGDRRIYRDQDYVFCEGGEAAAKLATATGAAAKVAR